MSISFRKSKKVGPMRLGVSRRGIGVSTGVPGFRVSRGADGKYRRTVSIPGSGLSHTARIGGGRERVDHDEPQHSAEHPPARVTKQLSTRKLLAVIGTCLGLSLMGGCLGVGESKASPDLDCFTQETTSGYRETCYTGYPDYDRIITDCSASRCATRVQ
jgi:hypothetical protein